jgi:hypothetical protein
MIPVRPLANCTMRLLSSIPHPTYSYHSSAVSAAEHAAISLYTVPNNLAVAMLTYRRQSVDRALKAIKGMGLTSRRDNLESLIVLITTNATLCHLASSPHT